MADVRGAEMDSVAAEGIPAASWRPVRDVPQEVMVTLLVGLASVFMICAARGCPAELRAGAFLLKIG